jgi:TonB family protein
MPRDLFGDVQQPSVRVGSRSRYTVPLSLAAHAVALLAVIAATIVGPVVLPGLASADIVYTTIVVPPAPPPMLRRAEPASPRANPNAAPVVAPDTLTSEPEVSPSDWSVTESGVGELPGITSFDTVPGDPPPPPQPPAVAAPVRVGGEIRPPRKVHDVAPVYPVIAQTARVEGLVIIEALIDARGRVQSTRVLRSIPLLDAAAVAAVEQWQYTPTLLNGTPVPVVMTVTVSFHLR